jgi:Holliday junction DNA helicase RuvA
VIGSLRGRILDRDPVIERSAAAEVLLEVGGVGYRVSVTAATLERLRVGEEAQLHIHHHIREADQKLYGFQTKDERLAFEGLLAAHGVGPALALAVLATHPAHRLAQILADDDLQALCEVPGVGKKTAQRLLVELRSTLVLPVLDDAAGPTIDLNGASPAESSALADVREALANLGYSTEEIRRALNGVADTTGGADGHGSADAGQLLRAALRTLAGG